MRQLPIGQTINHMLASTYNNMGFAVRAQWPWVAILVAAYLFLPLIAGVPLNMPPEQMAQMFKVDPGFAARFFILIFAIALISVLALSSIAVNWHRYILLNEVPQGMEKLRIDGSVWRYFGNALLIGLIVFPALIPIMFLGFAVNAVTSPVLFLAVMLIYMVVAVVPLFYRLSIKLPAVALGRHDFGFSDAMQISTQNWWQLVAVGFLVTAISWTVDFVLKMLTLSFAATLGASMGMWADVIVRTGVNWFMGVIGITLFTSLYGFFVEKRDF